MRLRDALEAGELDVVDAELDRLARLAAESRRTYYRWCLLVLQAARAIFAGRLAEGERLAEEAVELNRRHGDDADQEHTVQRLALALQRRRPQRRAARRAARLRRALPGAAGVAGDARAGGVGPAAPTARARSLAACARDGFAALLRTPDWLCGLALLAEPVAARGDAGAGRARWPRRSRRTPARNAVMDDAWAAFGPVARPLGLLAAAAGRREEAAAHFAQAVELAARWRRARLGARGDRRLAARAARRRRPGRAARRGLALARDARAALDRRRAAAAQTTTP